MRILQVNTSNLGGGAESVATRLLHGYARAGHRSWLAVGRQSGNNHDGIYFFPRGYGAWGAALSALAEHTAETLGDLRGAGRVAKFLDLAARPPALIDWWHGREDFNFPGTAELLELTPEPPDIVHAHNLHGGYFDLRQLPMLSARVPFVLNPHDAWMLSGHCAHSFDCERWKTGCGDCPDLSIYQAIRKDASADNWRAKQRFYAGSRLYVSTASQWLMDKVEQSILAPGIVESRVIPYGVETDLFKPGDRAAIRRQLGLPANSVVLLFVARGLRTNRWKDYPTLERALEKVAGAVLDRPVLFLGLGDAAPSRRLGNIEVRFEPFEGAKSKVAAYYQAADVYLHPAREDNAPQTVMEAMACGIPVIASAVAGIPEQVRSLGASGHGPDRETGILVGRGDAGAMAQAIADLASDAGLRTRLGHNARRDALERFDVKDYVAAFVHWFEEILERDRR